MPRILFQQICSWRSSRSPFAVVVVLFSLVAGACSPGGSDEGAVDVERSPTTIVGEEDGDGAEAEEPGELAFAGQERIQQEVRLGLTKPDSYRPDQTMLNDQSAVIIADLLYDGLTEAGPDEQLLPALAKEWSANDDFTEWTFLLAENAGVSAEDVVNSLRNTLLGVADGTAEAAMANVETVEALDDKTVVIELFEANAGFAWIVSGLAFSVAGPDGATTGRFELAEENEEGLVLRPGVPGSLPDVNVVWSETAEQAYDLLTLGFVDASVADVASIEDAGLRFGADFPARSITRFYVVNGAAPGLETPEARQALVSVLDSDALVASDASRFVVRTDGLVADSVTGFRYGACGAECEFVPGSDILIDRPVRIGYFGHEQGLVSETMVAQLVAAGYQAEAVELDADELADRIVDGSLDIFSFGWIAPAGSVDAVVPLLLAPGSTTGVVDVESESIISLLEDAATTEADQKRWDLLVEAHTKAISEGRIVPLGADASVLARAPHAEIISVRADGSIDLTGLQP